MEVKIEEMVQPKKIVSASYTIKYYYHSRGGRRHHLYLFFNNF